MKIKFVQNFRGRETKEKYFAIGDVADLDTGANLVERGVAVEVKPAPKPVEKPVEKAEPKPRRKVSK